MAAALPGRPVAPWLDGREPSTRPALARDLDVDVAVIGGGIVGVTAALLAKREGARVALLEAQQVGAGVTGRTTAKVTSLHGLIYGSLASQHSPEVARAYGEANEAGVATVAGLAEELEIDCDLRRKPSLTYSEDPGERGTIEDEVTAALAAGLQAAWADNADLPFPIAGAITVSGQVELHPLAYLDGLAAALDEGERAIYERTRATGVSGTTVETAAGHTVRAGHVIVATQLPFLDRGLFFARAKPSRSCALSVRIDGPVPQAMHLSTEQPPHSLRALPWGGEELLIVAGEGHTMGQADPAESFRRLERYARERLGAVAVEHRWSAHDYIPEDSLPYVGRLWPRSERVLMATGMQKWGLAMGTTAAGMLSGAVAGRPSEWAEAFDPWRLPPPRSAAPLAKHNLNAGVHFFGDRLRWRREVDDLGPGEGRVVGAGPGRRAVHRDEDGSLHALSARCTHLGCIVEWNAGDRTWDCPCHGSRFAASGEVLSGPATAPLAPRDPG